MAAFNVLAADDQGDAERQQQEVLRSRVALLVRPGSNCTRRTGRSGARVSKRAHLRQMITYSASETPDVVHNWSTSSSTRPAPTS